MKGAVTQPACRNLENCIWGSVHSAPHLIFLLPANLNYFFKGTCSRKNIVKENTAHLQHWATLKIETFLIGLLYDVRRRKHLLLTSMKSKQSLNVTSYKWYFRHRRLQTNRHIWETHLKMIFLMGCHLYFLFLVLYCYGYFFHINILH